VTINLPNIYSAGAYSDVAWTMMMSYS